MEGRCAADDATTSTRAARDPLAHDEAQGLRLVNCETVSAVVIDLEPDTSSGFVRSHLYRPYIREIVFTHQVVVLVRVCGVRHHFHCSRSCQCAHPSHPVALKALSEREKIIRNPIATTKCDVDNASVRSVYHTLFAWPEMKAATHLLSRRDDAADQDVRAQVLMVVTIDM